MGQIEQANKENIFEAKGLWEEVCQSLEEHFSCGGVAMEPLQDVLGAKSFCPEEFSDVFGHFVFGQEQSSGEIAGFKVAEDVLKGFHFEEGGRVGALMQLEELESKFFTDLKGALSGVEAALNEQLPFVGDAERANAIQLGPGVEAVFDDFKAKLAF